MKTVRITRVGGSPEHGTFGILTIDGMPECVTLEDYWRSNSKNVSCIPTGQYVCKRYVSSNHPNTFEVTNVEGRSHILFHSGNTHADTEGCILLGSRIGNLGSSKAILESRLAFRNFINSIGDDYSFNLIITESF
jgi:hypothetical protein